MEKFAYDAPAEIYSNDGRVARRRAVTYRRFGCSAEAIRFVIEELPQSIQPGTVMEVDGDRIQIAEIRALYDSEHYPLSRLRVVAPPTPDQGPTAAPCQEMGN